MKRFRVRVLLGYLFLESLARGVFFPVSTLLAQRLGADPLEVALLGPAYAIPQMLASVAVGRLIVRHGYAWPVFVAGLACATGTVAMAGSGTLFALYVGRVLLGTGTTGMLLAQAEVADTDASPIRSRLMLSTGLLYSLGFAMGAGLGGPVGIWVGRSEALLIVLASTSATIQAGGGIAVALALAWTANTVATTAPTDAAEREHHRRDVRVFLTPTLVTTLGIAFACNHAFVGLEYTLPSVTRDHLGWDGTLDPGDLGYAYAVLYAMQAVVVAAALRFHDFEREALDLWIGVGLASIAVGLGCLFTLSGTTTLVLSTAFLGAGYAFVLPLLAERLSGTRGRTPPGPAMGLLHGAASAGRLLGPVLMGLAYRGLGFGWSLGLSAAWVLVGISTLVFGRLRGRLG